MKLLNKMQEFRDMFLVRTDCPVGSTYKQHILNFSGHIHLGYQYPRHLSSTVKSQQHGTVKKAFPFKNSLIV